MARHAVHVVEGDAAPTIGLRPERTTSVVIDLPSLAGRTHTDVEGIVTSLDGRPVSVWAVEQLLCDSWVAALVTDADGSLLDATDRTADFTPAQRRLIAARDRHCVFPGCSSPPSWCDIHHLHWRSAGGGRRVENGALLCRRHHALLHLPTGQRWTLRRAAGGSGWHATSPTGRVWTGHPGTGREPPDDGFTPAA